MSRLHSLADTDALLLPIEVKQYGIKGYDVDNAYPQRMMRLINSCSTAKQACNLLAKFQVGQGFDTELSGPDFYKTKINSKGLTPEKLLRRNAKDKSEFRGFAVHVNYNALYQIVSVNYVPFEQCRLGIEENEGKICIYPSWERRLFGKTIIKADIKVIDSFNPDPFIIESQVKAAGGWSQYKGQVYYHSDDYDEYPISSIGSVLESVKADIASDKTTTNNLKNNFALKTIWVEKGRFESNSEREKFKREQQKFIGPDGQPLALIEVDNEEQIPTLLEVKTALDDKLFEYTDKKVRQKIYRAFNQHSSLHSDVEGTSFNSQNLRDTYAAYNGYTQDDRLVLEEVYGEIFSRFHVSINPSGNYTIKRLQYLEDISNANTTSTNNQV